MSDLQLLALLIGFTFGMVSVIMWIMARIGGWRTLAERFPQQPYSEPSRRGLTSIRLRGMAGYNNCVLWRADNHFLHLRIMRPFACFHPPISIPWEAIELPPAIGRWSVRLRAADIPIVLPARVMNRSLEVIASRDDIHSPPVSSLSG